MGHALRGHEEIPPLQFEDQGLAHNSGLWTFYKPQTKNYLCSVTHHPNSDNRYLSKSEVKMSAADQGANETKGRWLTIPRTLCFILKGDDILLMKRAANRRVFPNRYNGVGGHIERGEDPYTSAKREILEETGLEVESLQLRAIYNIDAGEDTGIILFVFTGTSQSRVVSHNTEEGTLHWIPQNEILNLELVEDLPVILPRILNTHHNELFFVHASYDENDHLVMQFANQ